MATVKFSKNVQEEDDTHGIIPGSSLSFTSTSSRVRLIEIAGALLIIVLLVIVIALSVVLGIKNAEAPHSVLKRTFCTDDACLSGTVGMSKLMNKTVDPCADFYHYACGQFEDLNPLDAETAERSVYRNILADSKERLENILVQPIKGLKPTCNEFKVKAFFKSCMDQYSVTKAAGKPLVELLDDALGTWFLRDDVAKLSTEFDLQESFKKTHADYMIDAFFTVNVKTNTDMKSGIIEIDQSGLGMYYRYYLLNQTENIRVAYKSFIRNIAELLIRDSNVTMQADVKKRRLDTFVDDVFTFETALANFTQILPPSANPNDTNFRKTLGQLNASADKIKWVDFFQYMFNEAKPPITKDTEVILREKLYIYEVNDLIDRTDPRVLNNYFTWRLAQGYASDLSWDYVHANREFYEATTGRTQFKGTWQYCFDLVSNKMRDAVGALFIKSHFDENSKPEVENIGQNIRNLLKERLPNSEWMDDKTQKMAKKKLGTIVDKIGYPEYLMDDKELDSIYEKLEVHPTNFFSNVLSIAKFEKSYWNDRLNRGIPKDHWRARVFDVQAYYNQYWNEVLIPAGFLQVPIYSKGLPKYMMYGSIGSIMGHEFINAIDAIGGFYLPNGTFYDWWTNKTTHAYIKERKCVVNYYNSLNYTIQYRGKPLTFPLHGGYYSRYAIAETGGVRNAFKAYKQWVKDNGEELLSPAVELSNDQAFFVSYAQTNCYARSNRAKFIQNYLRQQIPEEIRTNGAMAHIEEFAKAFNCPADSNLNVQPKCSVF